MWGNQYSKIMLWVENHPQLILRTVLITLLLIIATTKTSYAAENPYDHRHISVTENSLEVPRFLTEHLNKTQLYQVAEELNQIKVYTPEQFFVYLRNSLTTVLNASKESLVLLTGYNVTKISLYGMHNDPFWGLFLKTSSEEVRRNFVMRSSSDSTKIQREILGQLIWRTYDHLTYPITAVSSDLQAMQRGYEYGRPLIEVLQNPNLYSQYNVRNMWQEVWRIQKLSELMLKETGLSVDLRSPSNFILMGDKRSVKISNIDYELILPDSKTKRFYRGLGRNIPNVNSVFQRGLNIKSALLVPDFILTSPEWNLNAHQALDYMQAKHTLSRIDAARALSRIPKFSESFVFGKADGIDFVITQNKNVQPVRIGRCVSYLF